MKKKLMSVLLAAAMVASMAVGCGSDKKASSDSGDTKKTESTEKKTESNQILFNGSSTLAPVITSIATNFFDTYGTWDAYDSSLPKEDIAIYVSAGGSGQGLLYTYDMYTLRDQHSPSSGTGSQGGWHCGRLCSGRCISDRA